MALGVIGTGIAYLLLYGVVDDAGTIVSSAITYLIPVVSIVLGAFLLGERLTLNEVLGFVIVLSAALVIGRPEGGWRSVWAKTRR